MTNRGDRHGENHSPPLTAYQVWEGLWVALKERQDQADLRLSDDLQEFMEQTKQLVSLAEEEKLDPSPLVLFLAGAERFYRGVGTGIPKLTSAESDPDWRSVIHFPGKSGGHYRIG